MRLIVVRHGRTPFNVEGRFTGQLDIPLDELGERQAEALGRRLSETRLDAVVSSDLGRARATAQAIAYHHSLPVEGRGGEDVDLGGSALGRWEGST